MGQSLNDLTHGRYPFTIHALSDGRFYYLLAIVKFQVFVIHQTSKHADPKVQLRASGRSLIPINLHGISLVRSSFTYVLSNGRSPYLLVIVKFKVFIIHQTSKQADHKVQLRASGRSLIPVNLMVFQNMEDLLTCWLLSSLRYLSSIRPPNRLTTRCSCELVGGEYGQLTWYNSCQISFHICTIIWNVSLPVGYCQV